jgi:rubrerythrin
LRTVKERLMKESTQKSLDVLTGGINAELAAYMFYKKAAWKVDNEKHIAALDRLASEEKDHYWTLEAEYDSLVRSEKWVTYNDLMRKSGLPEMPEEMAETHKKRIDALDDLSDIKAILKLALELENEAYNYYSSQMVKMSDPAAKEMLQYLSKFEMGHINLITKWMKEL